MPVCAHLRTPHLARRLYPFAVATGERDRGTHQAIADRRGRAVAQLLRSDQARRRHDRARHRQSSGARRTSSASVTGPRSTRCSASRCPIAARSSSSKLIALQRALRGEQFVYEGRAVKVTPPAYTPGGPRLAYGGHSIAAARRAGRLGLDMFAEGNIEGLLEAYQQAARAMRARAGHGVDPRSRDPDQCLRGGGPRRGVGQNRPVHALRRHHLPLVDGRQHGRVEPIRIDDHRRDARRERRLSHPYARPGNRAGQERHTAVVAPALRRHSARVRVGELRLVGERIMPALKQ